MIVRLANKIKRFPEKFKKYFQAAKIGVWALPTRKMSVRAVSPKRPFLPMCTDSGCACYFLKSHIRRYTALLSLKKPRAHFYKNFRVSVDKRRKNVRWKVGDIFTFRLDMSVCPMWSTVCKVISVQTVTAILKQLMRPDLLILDDLGAERNTSYGKECVFDVVNRRLLSGKPMIITTNITLSAMQKATDLDDRRIYDRILEVCVPILFNGENFRKGSAAENLKKAAELLKSPLSWIHLNTYERSRLLGRKKKLINNTTIPQREIEIIARCIFPDILAFYESEEGQREFAEWKAQQIEKANKVNAPQDTE